jgi:CDGSH-type Zn-finger protein
MAKKMRIVVQPGGPYQVEGTVPLVRKTQVASAYGERLTWRTGEKLEAGESYDLCRCGHSEEKPFCDSTHRQIDFDGAETADTRTTAERQRTYPGSTGIVVKYDGTLCTYSGFCSNRKGKIRQLVQQTDDVNVRSSIIGMVERCPSGALTYTIWQGEPDIEPDLPEQIAVTTETTANGLIEGPLWVTGGIPVERADGEPLETRNRVTLCSCGESQCKPLCDGTHRRPKT